MRSVCSFHNQKFARKDYIVSRDHTLRHTVSRRARPRLIEKAIELHASLGHVPRSKTNQGVTVNP